MNPGEIVSIYQKPLTEEGYEGNARLVKRLYRHGTFLGRHLVRWTVRFIEDGDDTRLYERSILYPELHPDPPGD
jgi:hypothetical protein